MKRAGREGVAAEKSRGGLVERVWLRMRYIYIQGPDGGRRRRGVFPRGPGKGVADEGFDMEAGRRAAAEGR